LSKRVKYTFYYLHIICRRYILTPCPRHLCKVGDSVAPAPMVAPPMVIALNHFTASRRRGVLTVCYWSAAVVATCISAIRQWRSLYALVFSTSADSCIRSPDTYPRRCTRSSTPIGPLRKHMRPGLNSPSPPIGRCNTRHLHDVIVHVNACDITT